MMPRPLLLAIVFGALALQAAWALPASFQEAWLEEDQVYSNVFAAGGKAIGFKRPANAFASAFNSEASSSRRLWQSAGSAASSHDERHVLNLSCTTAIATNVARAVFSLTQDGALYRFSIPEGGSSVRYQACTRDVLNVP